MANIFIIHGFMGHPQENWFPWLKSKLEENGHHVFVPKFPTPENQSLTTWLETFQPYEAQLREDSIFIGHSLGVSFILSILERLQIPVQAAFLVGGFVGPIEVESVDVVTKTFTHKVFDWPKIRHNARHFYVFNGDNDPYVSIEKGQYIAKQLHTDLIVVPGAGHFNLQTGYDRFDLLLDKINTELTPASQADQSNSR